MATCKLCESSGWLITLDNYGLCGQCQTFHLRGIVSHRRIVLESLEIIQSSRDPLTRLSRINVAIHNCLKLEPYDRKGIRTLTAPPIKVVEELSKMRIEIVKDEIREQVHSARRKAKDATTIGGKVSGYTYAIEKMTLLMGELDDVTLVESAIMAIRMERDMFHFDHLFQKGEAAEAKGKTNRRSKPT